MFLVVAVCYSVTGSYGVLLVVTSCYWLLLFGTVSYGLLPVVTVCSWLLLFFFFFFTVLRLFSGCCTSLIMFPHNHCCVTNSYA